MDPPERLVAAVKAKDPAAVRALLAGDPALVRTARPGGIGILQLALYLRASQVVDALLAAGAEPDAFEAAILGDVPRLRALVAKDRGLLAAQGPDGACVLHLAAHFGRVDALRALLNLGAPVDGYSGGVFGNTALHAAAAGTQAAAVDALLAAGATPGLPDKNGYAPAHVAAANGSVPILKALAARGADLRARAPDGRTPLDLAREREMEEAAAYLAGD
jgi:ankyrin repeat protein